MLSSLIPEVRVYCFIVMKQLGQLLINSDRISRKTLKSVFSRLLSSIYNRVIDVYLIRFIKITFVLP